MSGDIHAERREPAPPDGPVDLVTLGDEVLAQARELQTGRSARTLTPGAGARLKQTLLAVTEGSGLQEHRAPGAATIQVLRGEVRMQAADTALELSAGEWALIPDETHDLRALSDATLLLTVVSESG